MSGRNPAAILFDENGNPIGVTLDGGVYRLEGFAKLRSSSGTNINPATEDTVATLASESKLEQVRVLLASLDGKDYATETKLEAVRVLLASLDGKDYATQTTLNALLTAFNSEDFASQTTLSAMDARLTTIDSVLDSIKDVEGIKRITDGVQLNAGTAEIGAVAQGTKAANADAWPIVQVDSSGNPATITLDAGVYRQEVTGKVTVVGAQPPPATTAVNIFAATPLAVGTHDTTYIIPSGQVFHLQQLVGGNEDPTKGAVIEVYYNNGTLHLVTRMYTNGSSTAIGYSDRNTARDGTSLLGNGTNTIIVRRTKYSGSDIAIDAVASGYVV